MSRIVSYVVTTIPALLEFGQGNIARPCPSYRTLKGTLDWTGGGGGRGGRLNILSLPFAFFFFLTGAVQLHG